MTSINSNIGLVSLLALSIFSAPVLAFEPLQTPAADDMVLYDDEENSIDEAQLGKVLFFDPRLSINHKQSCATCHDPELGFSDGVAKGVGTKGNTLGRNTPQLYNLGWSSIFMWDGREPTLESQALGPIVSEHEMDLPLDTLVARLNAVPKYKEMFKSVYGVDDIKKEEVGRAIAAFERTIVVDNTQYDKYLAGNTKAMSEQAVNGLKLFAGKANCVRCHDGANFTDDSFHSLGAQDGDKGRGAISGDATQNWAFKTPGLRNIEFSAPYMHDGSLASLESVVDYYNLGGGGASHVDPLVEPLNLSQTEKDSLVAFMKALSQPLTFEVPAIPKGEKL